MKCVQCHKELIPLRIVSTLTNDKGEKITGSDTTIAHYCTDPACPNYKLLQVGE